MANERLMAERSYWLRAQAVAYASTEDFSKLFGLAGLDPARHLRFADWSGLCFAGADLRGFDFTGARLLNCDFTDALISGARFDQAEIDLGRPYTRLSRKRTNIRTARDWADYCAGWKLRAVISDDHLPIGSAFQDAPFAPEMIVVPAGRFIMGSPPDEIGRPKIIAGIDKERQHEVTIERPFAIGRFPVTVAQWQDLYYRNDREETRVDWDTGQQPMVDVSWLDAQQYTEHLSERTGKPYRLLTEAEWEYCCRAGTSTAYGFGSQISKLRANYQATETRGVGKFLGNAWGLHDMHGGVWEWCFDRYLEEYSLDDSKDNAKAQFDEVTHADAAQDRVYRGGAWNSGAEALRSAYRGSEQGIMRLDNVGFRVARSLIE
jgi:formylglycine-generating enzyme required for sulfatase activity